MAWEAAKMTQFFAILAVFGMACLIWLAYGWLLAPTPCPIRATIQAEGMGDGVERTLRGLLWLRRSGVWHGEILIRDCGLTREGLALAMQLSRQYNVNFIGK